MFIVSAPSGAGKSTLCRMLLERRPNLELSVSHTTRAPRPGERDGRDYHFVDDATFTDMVERGGFVEWFEVHGHRYGTARSTVEGARRRGHDLLLDVDVQGAFAVKEAYPDAVSVFILPPSMAELEARLRGRGTETEESIGLRLSNARRELEAAPRFDFLVVNDVLDEALDSLDAIYRAMGMRTSHNMGLLEGLLRE